jgi:DNA-binding transcriptional MerR regulator
MMKLYEVTDVSRALGVSADAIRHLTRSGRLTPTATTPRGLRLFDAEALERLRRERAVQARKPRAH